jgi:hypothetical protein
MNDPNGLSGQILESAGAELFTEVCNEIGSDGLFNCMDLGGAMEREFFFFFFFFPNQI